ncbi:MBL fold metallo-hydrolase [Shinella sp. G-2]|uniref:MBL fold metallo-hydrolase n=1 Tax=Shinella sp. G-2 TaxID=3133141 RepID=UPI003D06F1F5
MKPIFANSAFVTAPERLVLRKGRWRSLPLKVRYGLFRHPEAGLVLVDAGYGPRVVRGARSLALRLYNALFGPKLVEDGQPEAVLRQLGATPADVAVVVLTHVHADHVSTLDLFPQARIIAKTGLLAQVENRGLWQNLNHGVFAELLPKGLAARAADVDGFALRDAPLGLGRGRDLFGDGSVLAIDLPGHAEGHYGLCFAALPVPLLYAVDTQWLLAALPEERQPGFPASLIANDRQALAESARRVLAFRQAGGDVLLCHDPGQSPYDLSEVRP